ncbi:MAG: ferrochelatase [Bacteroidia bacterium]
MSKKIGVVLTNLGGPNNAEAVQPFLYNLFMDEDIIRIPKLLGLKPALLKFLTTRRAKKVVKKYEKINACPTGCQGPKTCENRVNKVVSTCCSATNPITEWQRRGLEKHLNGLGDDNEYKVVTAMRYWLPSTDMAIDELMAFEAEEIVLVPLYPHFSYTTTASSLNEWFRRIRARKLESQWETHLIKDYHLHPGYLKALNQRIDEALEAIPEDRKKHLNILFSAHGTPEYFRNEGDPYADQIHATMEAIMAMRGHDYPYWKSYQSRVGPIKWMLPNTEDFLDVLHGYGIEDLLVVPISFVSDHIETTMEIGEEFKEVADELGMKTFEHTAGINDMPAFIETLGDVVLEKLGLREPDSVSVGE